MFDVIRERPSSDELVAFMRSVKDLSHADEDLLRQAEKAADWVLLPSRQVLMRQGQDQTSVYLLVRGKLRFQRRNDSGDIILSGEILPGEILGDVSLFRDRKAATTVFSLRDCQFMRLDGTYFESLLLGNPSTLMAITSKILRQVEHGLSMNRTYKAASVALIPLSNSIRVTEFAEALTSALKTQGSAVHMHRKLIESNLGSGRADLGVNDPKFAENLHWISKYTADIDVALFETDSDVTPWTEQCLREADRYILVGEPSDVSSSPVERLIRQSQSEFSPKVELVIVHPGLAKPKKTAAMFETRVIERHHHVWMARSESIERLARILAGNSIGLVLGGGGVRAAAHIGLIRAFQEAGIPIDHVGGTSIGSLIGAVFARGMNTDEMKKIILDRVVNDNLFNDYVPPFVSLARGRKFSNLLQEIMVGDLIEDLTIDYFSATTNLTNSTLTIFDKGPLWKAVRASASLPAILPPFAENGSLYLDGGLLDNVPGIAMRRRGAGRVVAIDVGAAVQPTADIALGGLIIESGATPPIWQLIRKKLTRNGKDPYTGLGDIISRSMVLSSRDRIKEVQALADLYVRMPVDDWKMLDFKAMSDLIDVGYEHASKHVSVWRELLLNSK